MVSQILKLTSRIVMSHASTTALKPKQLVDEIREIYDVLVSLDGGAESAMPNPGKDSRSPSENDAPLPLKDIVRPNYVVCLECGRKMRSLKAHLTRTHNLMPKDYYRIHGLDPGTYPLVCSDYSEKRRKLALEKGLGTLRKKTN